MDEFIQVFNVIERLKRKSTDAVNVALAAGQS
jgi:hypothetical protein